MRNLCFFRLFFGFGCALHLTPSISFAEDDRAVYEPMGHCLRTLNSHPIMSSKKIGEMTSSETAGAYINLLEQTLAEIGSSNIQVSDTARSSLQLQILQTIAASQTPIDPILGLQKVPQFNSLFNQNHFLRFLISANAYQRAVAILSDSDWILVQYFASNQLSSISAQLQTQIAIREDSKQDFVEVAPDSQGRVRLHYLIEQRDFAEAIALLQHPTTTTRYVNTRDRSNQTPLDLFNQLFPKPDNEAAKKLAAALAKKGALTSREIRNWELMLGQAAERGNFEFVALAYQNGADINFQSSPFTESPLMTAARLGKIDFVKELLSYGAVLESGRLRTPIIAAANCQHSEIVQLLGDSGADLLVPRYPRSLPEIAIDNLDWRTLRVLATLGVDLNAHRKSAESPIFQLVKHKEVTRLDSTDLDPFFQIFKDFNVDLNQLEPSERETLAHRAVQNEDHVFLLALANHGADLDKPNKNGVRPVDLLRFHAGRGSATNQKILGILYRHFSERGISPASRGLQEIMVEGKVSYRFQSESLSQEGED